MNFTKDNVREFDGIDIYSVCVVDGKKCIHIDGYFYMSDYNWSKVDCTFCYLDIDENLKYQGTIDDAYMETKEYQYDGLSDEKVAESLNGYGFNGLLRIGDVTEDTPCGFYLNK